MRTEVKIGNLRVTRGALVIATVNLMALFTTTMAWWFWWKYSDALRWTQYTVEVERTLLYLRADVRQAEAGGRGFVLTGQDEDFQDFTSGLAGALSHHGTAAFMTKDNPYQQERLDQVGLLVRSKFAVMAEMADLVKRDKKAEAITLVRTGRSRQYTVRAELLIDECVVEEERLMDARRQEGRLLFRWSVVASFLALFLGVAGLILAWHMTREQGLELPPLLSTPVESARKRPTPLPPETL